MYILVCPFSRSFDDKGLIYLVPNFLEESIKIGQVVEIPFGTKIISGIILKLNPEIIGINKNKIRIIESISYEEAFFSNYQVELLFFLSKYYFSLLHNCLSLFFPKNLRNKIEKNKLEFNQDIKTIEYSYNNNEIFSPKQQKAFSEIENNKNNKILFYGVTGSGKTSIYIKLIKKYIDNNKQCLLLVPEIILTSQISDKIKKIFGKEVLIINSSITDLTKTKSWLKIHSGEAKIIVGTRSALFYPYKNLALIIIDEEHDRSYLSDNSPRYDAREVAFKLSDLLGIKIILGSGTPSTNYMYKAIKKEIGLVSLLEEYR